MLKKYFYVLLFPCIVSHSCKENSSTLFTRIDRDITGINFKNTLFDENELNIVNYAYFYNGGGVAIGDINNDGLQDILLTGNMVRNQLFLNKGNFEFENISAISGIEDIKGWSTGATMADVNSDGKLDIYICRSLDGNAKKRQNLLLINNGNLTFTDRSAEFGLADTGYSTQAAFFDFDKDGDLDCFVINHSLQEYSVGLQDRPELRDRHDPAYADKLYRNDNGHFIDVSKSAGITSSVITFSLGVAIADFNNDGWPDIAVSNDFNEPDYLFINNRNGTFAEDLSKSMDEASLYSMGSDAADFDNDGLVDLVTLDMLPENNKTMKMHSGQDNFDKFQYLFSRGFYYQYSRNMLQKNNGDGTFSEVGQLSGVSNTDWSWSALFSDFDHDGYKDLFVSNGYVKDYTDMDFVKYSADQYIRNTHKAPIDEISFYIQKMPTIGIPNYIFQNKGNGAFSKKSIEWGFGEKGVSTGAAYADLDNDGDLDLVVNNSNDYAGIYKNNAEKLSKNHYISIRLQGNPGNERGIGAKIKLYCQNQQYFQEQSPVRGFQSSVDPVLNFGIGIHNSIDSLSVIWPDDSFQMLFHVKPDQILTLRLTDAKMKWTYDTVVNKSNSLLSQHSLLNVYHHENSFNDFTVQPLMPNYLSRQGPGIEVADINKDGLEDFFIGGAKGKSSQLFIQQANGTFSPKTNSSLAKDSISEDVAALFFDADNDGDNDLYVASGGYEFDENDGALQDRLYLNDGKGNFTINKNALPYSTASKSCVKSADIDNDGDLDLFVGGRVAPGRYPTAPPSYILINDGTGHFSDATASNCTILQNLGMVTDAIFIDLNKDKQPDLIIVGEWMPIKVFINKKGSFTDESPTYIHFPSSGWWNRIHADDMDGDGDLDIILGNCGLNTQFHVSEQEPMTLYYSDFDKNGSIDPILCYYIGGVSYPATSLDDLTHQLPFLKKKFLKYSQYSEATINDLLSPEQLKEATLLKTEIMQTIYLENKGNKGFELQPLPLPAQFSPVYGIATVDVNHDGKKDILLAGNNSWTKIKFGRYSANHGIVLLGNGKGGFTAASQIESGLNIRGNVRSLQLIKIGKSQSIIAGINDGNALMIQDR